MTELLQRGATDAPTDETFAWGDESLTLEFAVPRDASPRLSALRLAGALVAFPEGLPLVEALTVEDGHALASGRLVHTAIGQRSRYVSHHVSESDGAQELVVTSQDPLTGVLLDLVLERQAGAAAFRSHVRIRNAGSQIVQLRAVPSFSTYLGEVAGSTAAARTWTIRHGRSDWLAEARWTDLPLPGALFPDIAERLTNHNPRGDVSFVSKGTWSTGKHVPAGFAIADDGGLVWAWQIEHNGAWRAELNLDTAGPYIALSGPTDTDHNWLRALSPGDVFETVPVSLAVAAGWDDAVAEMTQLRRRSRRPHPDNAVPAIVFNDYMNTVNGDPTTAVLEPLIDAAAEVGAEVFCIDAGWYDNTGQWWDGVGEWVPSTTRFPGGGLGRVVARIRERGMRPGLWLEPEVVGVKSRMASLLPADAFLQRGGQRLVEHDRFVLDMRHPAARAHLDGVVDRLVEEFGASYFKLDYNVDVASGSDLGADSTGDALLEHNRAHLAWLDSVLDRHPRLVIENCSSGAMRADFAMLSRLQLQSTSDQQDPLKYPPIAASSPLSILPEQSASWAYPQPEMDDELAAFTLVTGLSGRFYLSGHLDRMTPARRGLVADAVALAKSMRIDLVDAVPYWPLGLPQWDDPWIALGLRAGDRGYLVVWNRDPSHPDVELPLSAGLTQIFPSSLPGWHIQAGKGSGTVHVRNPTGGPSARLFQLSNSSSLAS